MSDTFDATLEVQIEHIDGPRIADHIHILNWLVNEGFELYGRDKLEFRACDEHADPEECECSGAELESVYRVSVVAADAD